MGLFNTNHKHVHSYNNQSESYVKEVKITENKAPTDESIRLLNEMQEKARLNIIKSIIVEENNIKAAIVYYQNDIVEMGIRYHAKFTLNGIYYSIEGALKPKDCWDKKHREVIDLLFKKFSEAIAFEIFKVNSEAISKLTNS